MSSNKLLNANFQIIFLMTYNYRKSTNPIIVTSLSLLMLFSGISVGITSVFRDDAQNDFILITPDNLNNNPVLAKILENIEKSKKEFSDL